LLRQGVDVCFHAMTDPLDVFARQDRTSLLKSWLSTFFSGDAAMSIYATGWTMMLPLERNHPLDATKWVEVCAQFVPNHIGKKSAGYDEDPYSDFLPPIVPEEDEETPRAIVVVQVGREQKDCQRYVDPVLFLSGKDYLSLPFQEFVNRLCEGLKDVDSVELPTKF
jgi:hypothetical protein